MTNNDTSTLNGSLLEMKDQLISELANQGVTATYDPTTGLLGLIAKISEITPVVQTLTLASNKSILSYADSETATLTATHSGGAGKTVEIYNAVTGVKIGDATDNLDGTYTYTYTSTGVGDISMTATSGALESNAISIEDYLRYDLGTSDKTSLYGPPIDYRDTMNTTWNYDSTNGYYGTIAGSGEGMITLPEATGLNTVTIEFDALYKADSSWNGIAGLCAYEDNSHNARLSANAMDLSQRICNGGCNESRGSISISYNDLIHHKYEIADNQIKVIITKEGTQIGVRTINYTPTSNTKYGFAFVWDSASVRGTYYKNIKVKV